MEEKEFEVQVILDIAQGVKLLDNNVDIKPNIAYRIGNLGDNCESQVKLFEKFQQARVKDYNDQRAKLVEKTKEEDLSAEVKEALVELGNSLTQKLNEYKEQKKSIKVPELKVSDFVATEEVKRLVTVKTGKEEAKSEWITIKAGSLLVPTGFFRLMGDTIKA